MLTKRIACKTSSQILDPLEGDELVPNLGRNSAPEGPALASLTDKPELIDNQPVLIQQWEFTVTQG